jgi:hypothetical protein
VGDECYGGGGVGGMWEEVGVVGVGRWFWNRLGFECFVFVKNLYILLYALVDISFIHL